MTLTSRQRLEEELVKNFLKWKDYLKEHQSICEGEWGEEDLVYRFYHQSFKVFRLQELTGEIVVNLTRLLPEGIAALDSTFLEIVKQGTGKQFQMSMNTDWATHTRPIVEAYFHAKYFLDMILKYGEDERNRETFLKSGWAAVLTLYGIR
jgi:hypothetical protein